MQVLHALGRYHERSIRHHHHRGVEEAGVVVVPDLARRQLSVDFSELVSPANSRKSLDEISTAGRPKRSKKGMFT